jgi:hypothetical protein
MSVFPSLKHPNKVRLILFQITFITGIEMAAIYPLLQMDGSPLLKDAEELRAQYNGSKERNVSKQRENQVVFQSENGEENSRRHDCEL